MILKLELEKDPSLLGQGWALGIGRAEQGDHWDSFVKVWHKERGLRLEIRHLKGSVLQGASDGREYELRLMSDGDQGGLQRLAHALEMEERDSPDSYYRHKIAFDPDPQNHYEKVKQFVRTLEGAVEQLQG